MPEVREAGEHAYQPGDGISPRKNRMPPPGPVDIVSETGFGLHGTFTREELETIRNRPSPFERLLTAIWRRLRLR